jgi:hypothetical protein
MAVRLMESISFLPTIQTLKSGACGGPFFKRFIESIFWSSRRRFCLPKNDNKNYTKFTVHTNIYNQCKEMKKIRQNQGRVSKLVAQPFFSQGSPHS